MDRRLFLQSSAAAIGSAGVAAAAGTQAGRRREPFSMRFAPHFGMFRASAGDDPLDQLRFAADAGFSAWEDNGMSSRPIDQQRAIARELQRLDMRMGVFVANPKTAWKRSFGSGDSGLREGFLDECKASVEVAKRVGATWMTVVCGTLDPRLHIEFQTSHAIEQLRRAAAIFEPQGLVMVLEPLNPFRDHPGMLLARSSHAHAICTGVNSPACKILFDIYHQQITEGNLIPNIDTAWDQIAYFQIGDNPGRNEPTTGEIDYARVFAHIKQRGFTGVLGMEHGNSHKGEPGERAVIEAYRACDPG